ncbi:MAG: hypothetical protein ACI82O_003608, partial [Patiriisocius sp.]
KVRRYGSPRFAMGPSFTMPPVPVCLGTGLYRACWIISAGQTIFPPATRAYGSSCANYHSVISNGGYRRATPSESMCRIVWLVCNSSGIPLFLGQTYLLLVYVVFQVSAITTCTVEVVCHNHFRIVSIALMEALHLLGQVIAFMESIPTVAINSRQSIGIKTDVDFCTKLRRFMLFTSNNRTAYPH